MKKSLIIKTSSLESKLDPAQLMRPSAQQKKQHCTLPCGIMRLRCGRFRVVDERFDTLGGPVVDSTDRES